SAFTTDGEVVPGVLLTPGLREIRLLEAPQPVATLSTNGDGLPVLTTAVEVHRLKREEAQRKYPVRVKGVVTSVLPEHQAFTLQDATRGLYVEDFTSSLSAPPLPGDFLEVEGATESRWFARSVSARRVNSLGSGKLPQPVHPAWDQLMNGSMDAQYVEVAGVVTTVESDWLTLLTSEGVVQVGLRVNGEKESDELKQYENAQVRLRGCLFSS